MSIDLIPDHLNNRWKAEGYHQVNLWETQEPESADSRGSDFLTTVSDSYTKTNEVI
jgi:hypothetical protein